MYNWWAKIWGISEFGCSISEFMKWDSRIRLRNDLKDSGFDFGIRMFDFGIFAADFEISIEEQFEL
jgi:hypothetical protein